MERARTRALCRRCAPIVAALAGALVALAARAAWAHERFIKHALKHPLDPAFFVRGPGPLGVNINVVRVGANVCVVIAAFLVLWFLRHDLDALARRTILRSLRGRPQRLVHQLTCFLTDRPIRSKWWHTVGEWAVIMFMRSPGLVLMYSAANDSLVMPSYPLDPTSGGFFKAAQVALAILILTQTLLPLCGAMIFGTWIYLNRWGVMVAVDAIPVVTVAVVYATSPWQSHKLAITELNATQLRWTRIVLGVGFVALGWLKVFNHNLVAGVADNYPSVMNDPMVTLMGLGANHTDLRREVWIVSFGMAEVMSGFLLLMGIFTRVWCAIMISVFTKLMVVDFGWEEIPHIYPIGALMAILFSNKLESEFVKVEEWGDRLNRQSRNLRRVIVLAVPSLLTAFIVVFPLLYAFTFFDRSGM